MNAKDMMLEMVGFQIYTRRPNQIRAIKLTYETLKNIIIGIETEQFPELQLTDDKKGLLVKTLEGTVTAKIGEYLVIGIKGEYYPCKANIFEINHTMV